ncbi:heavy-metal-associated domain-containing protein [Pseudoflavonifractor phocaeensis]|uniref:heavy-metal-associated domain-containing protein n=1 Tax=Pseudoflavonifractor phocaeensis TaxID=1870988 RepID=UPI001957EFB8|nr:heavy metal-associated domain-containing protein [Pseudoflavonifractor phocaeensis]MBM6885398.1 heavy-metal-associated domain-containing protein [Pseudoflavonifractor phocaeensis]
MIQYTIAVEGMACSMCEAHINDAVRKAFPVKKVTSSRSKKKTTVLTETELDEDALRAAISATGYEVGEIRKEPWAKKGLFGR